MSKSSDPRKQYLKKRGERWFLNYPIPVNLQPLYLTEAGNAKTHIVQAVGTGDLAEANRRKHGMIAVLHRDFSAKQRESRGVVPADMAVALAFRQDIQDASNAENYEQVEILELLVSDAVDDIVEKGEFSRASHERAGTFSRIARGAQTLTEAFEEWIGNTTLPARTRQKYRTALDEFTAFLGGTPLIEDMNRDNAIRYVDWMNREARSQRTKALVPLSYNTKRDRVGSLSSFWNKGLSARRKTKERVSPWAKLDITQAPTTSTIAWHTTDNTRPKRREAFEEADLAAIYDAPGPRAGSKLRYACWGFLPLLWLIPSMSVEYWPPVYAMFVLDVCACSVGVVAAVRTVRTSRSAGLRVMAALLGSLYFLYIALAGVFDFAALVKTYL